MEEKTMNRPHKLMLQDRRAGSFTGVLDALSFDVNEILLETEQGLLHIKGKDLHVNRLDLDRGEVDIDGQVDALNYSQVPGRKGSFFGRLFSS